MKDQHHNIEADLWLEPTLTDTGRGIIFEISVERTKKSGTREFTKLRVRMPRDSVNRILYEVRKLHDKELANVAEDVAVLSREVSK